MANVAAQLSRMGTVADVLEKTDAGENEFGNTEQSYSFARKVIAFKTYPNRNTEVESRSGDRIRDNPVFLISTGQGSTEVVGDEAHLVFEGTEYELKAKTEYPTHIEVFGEPVLH